MKYEQYTSLIKELELYAEENPKGYEWRVRALGILGYGYFVGLLLIFLSFPLFVGWLWYTSPKLIWVVLNSSIKLTVFIFIVVISFLGIAWNFLKSFRVKVPAPKGYELSRAFVPKLFHKIEQMCDFLKAPRPDHILLVEDFNAAVVALPRFGIFGKKVYMLVGLPLMQVLSPAQFEAVLAHEIGHISEKHSSSAAWAYRLREIWSRFIASQEARGNKLSFLYDRFLNWYFPYFNAYSFVLLRRQEREADEYAVQLYGAQPLGEALINLEVKALHLSQKFWKDVLDEAARHKSPPRALFTRMARAFRESNKPQDLMNLSKAVAINTDYTDSHPSLSERLKRMGYWRADSDLPELPEDVTETASGLYLGRGEEKYSKEFNAIWEERVRDQWKQRHAYLIEAQKRIDELNQKSKTKELTLDELYERAELIADRYGEAESLIALMDLLEKNPDDAKANFAVGSVLLNDENEEGIPYLRKAMKLDRTLKIACCEALYYYLRSKGRDEEAKKYALAIEAEDEIRDLAKRERAEISPTDRFGMHSFPADKIEEISRKMRYYDEILAMYLVRKVVEYYSEVPLYVLFIDTKKKGWLGSEQPLGSDQLLHVVAERLHGSGIHYFAILENNFENLKPVLERIPRAKIYQRNV